MIFKWLTVGGIALVTLSCKDRRVGSVSVDEGEVAQDDVDGRIRRDLAISDWYSYQDRALESLRPFAEKSLPPIERSDFSVSKNRFTPLEALAAQQVALDRKHDEEDEDLSQAIERWRLWQMHALQSLVQLEGVDVAEPELEKLSNEELLLRQERFFRSR